MKLFTIGYGGRDPEDLVAMLKETGVQTIADVRLRPDRASMGVYTRAKTPDKGLERLLTEAGLSYVSLLELGNVFVELHDWVVRYRRLLEASGDLLTERFAALSGQVCLLCAEKHPEECHRWLIAEWLAERGWEVTHLV